MALSILDGTQTATTLSTILSSGQHITAHTVVSLGTQAITDITSAVSGTSVCVGSISISGTPSVTGSVSVLNFPASQSTTFGAVTGSVSVLNFPASQAVTFTDASLTNTQLRASVVTIGGTVTANLSISSTVITSGSFTSLTSATLVPANTARKMATVYNLGAGQLFVNAGVTATTLGGGFMVALSSGDFYECPYTTTTLSAIFATAGTASWVSH